jgi:hypothetical protein
MKHVDALVTADCRRVQVMPDPPVGVARVLPELDVIAVTTRQSPAATVTLAVSGDVFEPHGVAGA